MKNYILLILIILSACTNESEKGKEQKEWLGRKIDLASIQPLTNTYHMLDASGEKVGSMVFGFYLENGKLVARDTSQYDDGSVYEEAMFELDTTDFRMKRVAINMKINTTNLDVNFTLDDKDVQGMSKVTRDTSINEYPIDSTYSHNIVREELYMLMHTLDYQMDDTLSFKSLIPTSMTVSANTIYYVGDETVTVPAGNYDCTIIYLDTDGKMPRNKIWITKESPRKIVKFFVPGPDLSIELINSRKSI